MREGDYDSNNEHGLLRYNGPHLYRISGPSFIGVRGSPTVYKAKVIRVERVKISGIPNKANQAKEEGAQKEEDTQ
jgi:hypothetical protein